MSKELEQKQIEEIARELCHLSAECETCQICDEKHDCGGDPCYFQCMAKVIIKHNYRKQSENTVELPCKIGDTVYRVKKRRGIWCVLPREVVSITYRLDHLHNVVWEIFSTETDVLGKTVFLTEEEAEKKVAKMKGGE